MQDYFNEPSAVGLILGTTVAFALIVLVAYTLPAFISSKIFKITKTQALGVISTVYAILGIVLTAAGSITHDAGNIVGTSSLIIIVNAIIFFVNWNRM